jgi:pantetheine-phosphate adenylyltransferase
MIANKAIYAGSFDPFTFGHLYVVYRAAQLFPNLIVAVGTNPAKKPMFSADARMDMIIETCKSLSNIKCIKFEGEFLVHVAVTEGCTHIIRGIRNARDCEDELAMATINREIATGTYGGEDTSIPDTIFIPTPPELALVSSSMVKSLIGFGDWELQIRRYLPETVADSVCQLYKDKHRTLSTTNREKL